MTPPRTRKTTTADIEETTPGPAETTEPTEAPENKTAATQTETKTPELAETKTPDVAPLEPPAEPEPAPEPDQLTTARQLLPAQITGLIVDAATGQAPPDPDAVFVQVQPPHGNTFRCTARLIEHFGMGTYNTPATRLLVPIGADLKRGQMERVVARLRSQLAPTAE
ncbi:hypothetical protein ACFUJY_29280 [Streptomyces sp. NPDC057249]|uniref:hypothetical protein n=1 Tax=Streptomyces sp. NPDC057249 TaxID=3346067 RepID=UPI00362CF376